MLTGFDKLTNSRFTGDGELPVIQSVHNEELAALKLKIKKVALCKMQSSPSPCLKSYFADAMTMLTIFADAGGQ